MCVGNETILAAINQELTNQNKTSPSTNFICQSLPFEDATSDEEANIIVKNGQVYAFIKPTDDKKSKKKGHVDPKKWLIFDGVNIPQRHKAVKEELKEAMIPPSNPHIVMPPPMVYNTPAQPFNIGDNDIFMEDVSHEPTKVPKPKKKMSLPKTYPDGAPLTVNLSTVNLSILTFDLATDLPWK